MGAFLIYMLKSAICLIVFFLLFKVLLSRDTFFRFNRFILLGGMLACCLLPAMRLEVTGKAGRLCDKIKGLEEIIAGEYIPEQGNREQEAFLLLSDIKSVRQSVIAPHSAQKGNLPVTAKEEKKKIAVPVGMILFVLYIIGAFVVSVWLGLAFIRMAGLLRSGNRKKWGTYVLVLTREKVCPFSWGRYIVMNENDYRSVPHEILAHEKIHAEKRHTWDLCFTELLLVLQWFNPAIWLLKKELQEIHEYEADNGVINQGIDATQYQLLLVKKAVGARLYSIANSFDHSKLKNRITMMLKEKSNRWTRLKVLLLLPPAALLMLAFARPEEVNPQDSSEGNKITEIFGEIKNQFQESLQPEVSEKELQAYFDREFEKRMTEQEKLLYKKWGKHYIFSKEGKKYEIRYLLMNQPGNVLFGEKPVQIGELPALLADWKKENLKAELVFLYVKRDIKTPPQNGLKMLNIVRKFYDEVKDDPSFPLKVIISEPKEWRIAIVASTDENKYREYFDSFEELEKHLNTEDYGKYQQVEISLGHSCPDRTEKMKQIQKMVAEKGWDNVEVKLQLLPPPPPLPAKYIIQVVSKDTTKKAAVISGRTCGQLEQRLIYYKSIKPGEKVMLKLHKSLEQKDIDNVRDMLKKHQLEVASEIYFDWGKESKSK